MAADQKVAIVTGAAQGVGAGLVKGFRDLGYAVVANSRSIQPGHDAGITTVPGDIGERAVAEAVVQTAIGRYGRIDTLVNNAGIFIGKPFTDYSVEEFQRMVSVNLAGFFHVSQLALAQMLKQQSGHLVQITAALVEQPQAGVAAGLALLTKGGIAAVTRGLAIEYVKQGIRVNAVAPGIIDTPLHNPAGHDTLRTMTPMGRLGEVADVVKAVLYLENAPYATGETLHVDGGQHAGRW